jgi:hypothetical protein
MKLMWSCYKTRDITIYNIPTNSEKIESAQTQTEGKKIILMYGNL